LLRIYIFAGVPGSGKTSVIKHCIKYLEGQKAYVKVDVFFSEDDAKIEANFKRKEFSRDVCPDHYTAHKLEEYKIWAELHGAEHLFLETAGLCFRCSPYTRNAAAVAVVDAVGTDVRKLGPLIQHADIIAVTKYDLISQAERDIIKYRIRKMNAEAQLFEVNGISGEGCYELVKTAKEIAEQRAEEPMELRFDPPACICEFCYGSKSLLKSKNMAFMKQALELAKKIPKLNCGACGYELCNLFIRQVLRGKEDPKKCVFYKE